MRDFPDVLDCSHIEKATGYAHRTVIKWCARKKIKFFNIKGKYMIPKICLIEYLTENRCHALSEEAYKYTLLTAEEMAAMENPDQPEIIV